MVDATSVLKDWGLTFSVLAVVGVVATLVFIFSLREFAYWFLRTNQILKKQNEILDRLTAIEKELQKPATPENSKKEGRTTPEFQLLN